MEPAEITIGALRLRPWRPGDAGAVAKALSDPEIRRWTRTRADDPGRWIAERAAGWADGSSASFAITDVTTGEVLGHVRLRVGGAGAPAGAGAAGVGYWILPAARGRGAAAHALGAVARWAFTRTDLSRLELRHSVENPASCRVAQKAGFPLLEVLDVPSWDDDGSGVKIHLHTLVRE
ncbi:GNAT family N-acetyltransferase [Streptosporangium sp. NPDC004379]|uniref:GNAT family N-acetyltransferase n=1 Tax=Streptosporangium sp. NPDC004379 TaxID=3366189 RepID=UPI0036967067